MTTQYAWRCSPAFGDALIVRHEEERLFVKDVIATWNAEHDPIKVGLTSGTPWSLDRRVLGFFPMADGTVPDGLSASKKRQYLLPLRGPSGKHYREVLAMLNKIPSVNEVFKRFNVEWYAIAGDRVCSVGMHFLSSGVFLSCNADILGDTVHSELTRVRLSVFHAAKEAQEEIESAREKETAT